MGYYDDLLKSYKERHPEESQQANQQMDEQAIRDRYNDAFARRDYKQMLDDYRSGLRSQPAAMPQPVQQPASQPAVQKRDTLSDSRENSAYASMQKDRQLREQHEAKQAEEKRKAEEEAASLAARDRENSAYRTMRRDNELHEQAVRQRNDRRSPEEKAAGEEILTQWGAFPQRPAPPEPAAPRPEPRGSVLDAKDNPLLRSVYPDAGKQAEQEPQAAKAEAKQAAGWNSMNRAEQTAARAEAEAAGQRARKTGGNRTTNVAVPDSGGGNTVKIGSDQEAVAQGYSSAAEKAGAEKVIRYLSLAKNVGRPFFGTYEQAKKELEAERERFNALKQEVDTARMVADMQVGDNDFKDGRLVALTEEDVAQRQRDYEEKAAQLEAMVPDLTAAEYAFLYAKEFRYADLPGRDDWESSVKAGREAFDRDAVVSTKNLKEASREDQLKGYAYQSATGQLYGASDPRVNADFTGTGTAYTTPSVTWDQKDIDTFFYLFDHDKKAAEEFAYQTNYDMADAEKRQKMEELQEWGAKNAFTGSLAFAGGIAGNTLTALPDFLIDSGTAMLTGRNMPRVSLTDELTVPGTGTARKLNEIASFGPEAGPLEGVGLGTLYSAGQSLAQSRLAAKLGKVGSWLFYGSAANDAFQSAAAKGANPYVSSLIGNLCGLISVGTEEISLSNLINTQPGKNIWQKGINGVVQSLIEGGEEVTADLLMYATELAVLGDKADVNLNYWNNLQSGMNDREAQAAAKKDFINNTIVDGLVGAFSGGLSSMISGLQNISAARGQNSGESPAQKSVIRGIYDAMSTGDENAMLDVLQVIAGDQELSQAFYDMFGTSVLNQIDSLSGGEVQSNPINDAMSSYADMNAREAYGQMTPLPLEFQHALRGEDLLLGVDGLRQNAIAPLNPQAEAQTAQEAAGEAQTQAQAETAPTPAEAPTEAPALLNSEQGATAEDMLLNPTERTPKKVKVRPHQANTEVTDAGTGTRTTLPPAEQAPSLAQGGQPVDGAQALADAAKGRAPEITARPEKKTAKADTATSATRKLQEKFGEGLRLQETRGRVQSLAAQARETDVADPAQVRNLWESARQQATEILRTTENPGTKTGGDTGSEIRDYLRRQKIRIDERLRSDRPSEYESLQELRRKTFGTLNFSNTEGRTLDQVYQELGYMFGEGMFPQNVGSHSEIVERILGAVANERGKGYTYEESLSDAEYEQAVAELTMDLMQAAESVTGESIPTPVRETQPSMTPQQAREAAIESELEADFEGELTREDAERIVDQRFEDYGEYDLDNILNGMEDAYGEAGEQTEEFDEYAYWAERFHAAEGEGTVEGADAGSETQLPETVGQGTPAGGPAEAESGGAGEVRGPGSAAPDGEVSGESGGDGESGPPRKPAPRQLAQDNYTEADRQAADELYNELGQQYGTIEAGENPARESAVPQRTEKGDRVGKTVRTVYEAQATPESRLPDIRAAIVEGEVSHIPTSNDALAKKAEATIKRKGWEAALRDWTADVRSGKRSADLVAMGAVLWNNAANSDMSSHDLVDLLMDYESLVSGTGKALSASRILKTLTPESNMYMVQKTVSRMNEERAQQKARKAEKQAQKAQKKGRKPGAKDTASEEGRKGISASDNIPVSLWADKAGESVAEELGAKLKEQAKGKADEAKIKTMSQIAEEDVKKVLRSYGTESQNLDNRALENILTNPGFYNTLYESLRASLETKAGMSAEEIAELGHEWIDKPLADMLAEQAAGQPDIHVDEELVDAYLKVGEMRNEDGTALSAEQQDALRDQYMELILRDIARQVPSTIGEKIRAMRYLNMLGNLKTQERNLLSNAAMLVTTTAKDKTKALIELTLSGATGGKYERTTSLYTPPALLGEAFQDFNGVEDVALGEGKYEDGPSDKVKRKINDYKRVFKPSGEWGTDKATGPLSSSEAAKTLRKAVDAAEWLPEGYRIATKWAMEKGDVIFSRANYARALAGYLYAHKVTSIEDASPELLERAREYAIKQAQEATFRDSNAFSDWVGGIGRNAPPLVKVASEGLLAFRKTPANVLVREFQYSPLGVLATAKTAYDAVKGNATGQDVVESLSKNITGTGLFMLGAMLHSLGYLRTKEEDKKKEEFEKQQGAQDWSMTFDGGKSFSIDWLAPNSAPLLMGAVYDQIQGAEDMTGNDALRLAASLTEPLLQTSMLDGLNDSLSSATGYGATLDPVSQIMLNSMLNWVGQLTTNSLARQAAQASEENRRTSWTDEDSKLPEIVQKQIGAVSAGTPGWDYKRMDYVDAWGRKQNKGSLGERLLQSFVSPGNVGKDRSTPYDKELERLYDAGYKTAIPQAPSREDSWKTESGTITVPNKDYEEYAISVGQKKLELIGDFLDSDEYKNLDDDTRADIIGNLYDYARWQARNEYAAKHGDSMNDKSMEKLASVEAAGVDISDYLLGKQNADADGNGSLTNKEVYNWLLDSDYTDKQKEAIWDANKGSSAKSWEEAKEYIGEQEAKEAKKPENILASYGVENSGTVWKAADANGNNSVDQKEFFASVKQHPEISEDAWKAVFASKWPKSDFDKKKKEYS